MDVDLPNLVGGDPMTGHVVESPHEPRPLADYLAELPGGGRWGDRRVVKREGDVVLITRDHCDYVVAFDRPGPMTCVLERRSYFNFPTKNRTKQEARAAAEAEFARRTR